tara:strand:+ start:1180 stop:1629 length:450 start_codon:yes stop_codon:yes gene_type:complete
MALKVSYKDRADVTHANSYWVITDIKMFKKLNNTEDLLRKSLNLADGVDTHIKAPDIDIKKGYYLSLTVMGWSTKADRDAGKPPMGMSFRYPSEHMAWGTAGIHHTYEEGTKDSNSFLAPFDPSSSDNMLKQAYDYLKTLDQFKDATEV